LNAQEFARRMPKVELHVHLEGSIQPRTLLKLADRNNVLLPAEDEAELRDFYRFRNFDHFIEVYDIITHCLRRPEDYRLVAYEFGAQCARQNIRYAETTFTIASHTRLTGLPWQEILAALNEGRSRAREAWGVDWGWVFDIQRNTPESQDETVDIALAARDRGVAALGLGGGEAGAPAELFIRSFERARRAGLPRVPHAGEMAGPESVWAALNLLHADRIGHGVRCIEDPTLVASLRQIQKPLEVCPTSNIRLGVYPDYDSHPLRRLWDAGLLITVNSDDPPMFQCDLASEYVLLVERFGFDENELERLTLNALNVSTLPDEEKASLESEFLKEFTRLRGQPNQDEGES
jgi:aminodeoxyfutalosine deaminase